MQKCDRHVAEMFDCRAEGLRMLSLVPSDNSQVLLCNNNTRSDISDFFKSTNNYNCF